MITQPSVNDTPKFLAACLLLALAAMAPCVAQNSPAAPDAQPAPPPPTITLEEAIHRAQANEPQYAAAVAASRVASIDKSIARAGLLPSANFYNQGLYTQPNGQKNQAGQVGAQPAPRFIANNAVREYASQGVVDETIGLDQAAAVRRANAEAAKAAAEAEIARRGLVATVTELFYGSLAADHKLIVADEARKESEDFDKLTSQREQARESAHADVIKAQLENQQRSRDWEDAKVAAEKAHLELGVLLFPDPRTSYALAATDSPAPMPTHEDVEQSAAKNNPELKSALAALASSNADVQSAWGALLPNVGLNFNYGIDAPQFAVNGPDGVRNLGYSASVTVNIPVWDWWATENKVKQSQIKRDAQKVALTNAQRRMIAELDETYSEAQAARDQLESLDLSVTTAAESLRLTRLRYTGGEATVLEVVDAQSAYVSAANAREDGRVRYESARAALATLTGTM